MSVEEKNPSFKQDPSKNTIDTEVLPEIEGFTISEDIKLSELGDLYKKIGFQASHLGKATDIIRKVKEQDIPLFLSCTSNMGSSGLRELIAQLVKHKAVEAIITTTGLIEEDIMKTMIPFRLGSFNLDDAEVRENGLNRLGNIIVPNKAYVELEKFHLEFLKKTIKETDRLSPSEYVRRLGEELDDERSILYWAAKNNIPIYCPGFVDGSLGDHLYYFNKNRDEPFIIDVAKDVTHFYDQLLRPEQAAGLCLGAGIAKHHLIGAAVLRPNGLDYAVYLQTGTPYDGSLSGAPPSEAVSWNKIKSEERTSWVQADATLVLPILMPAL